MAERIKIKGMWWKSLGVILFLYVIIGGMTIPLRSGILSVHPGRAVNGDTVELEVTGYNTHFLSGGKLRAWLKLDSSHFTQALRVEATAENKCLATFAIPADMSSYAGVQSLTLLFDNEVDGYSIQPNAVFLTIQDSLSASTGWDSSIGTELHTTDQVRFPYRNILHETIRNTFFHIALWFAMFLLLLAGLWHAVMYLRHGLPAQDIQSAAYHKVAILFGLLGIATGSVWAKFTWNTFWTTDVKLNMTAVAMLIYLAYLILRNTITDEDKRARVSAGYSIFAFVALIPLVFVIPRLTDSLHPGNGGNPALGGEDLDNTLRLFFYPSILALTLLGNWMVTLLIRYEKLREKIFYQS